LEGVDDGGPRYPKILSRVRLGRRALKEWMAAWLDLVAWLCAGNLLKAARRTVGGARMPAGGSVSCAESGDSMAKPQGS